MKQTFRLLVLATLASLSAFGAEFKGTISDTMCMDKHISGTAADVECVKKCVKEPGDVVLIVSDSEFLKIDNASFAKVKPHLGHKVIIQGTIGGRGILMVESVKM